MKMTVYTFPMWLDDRCVGLREIVDFFADAANHLTWFIGEVENAGPAPKLLLESSHENPTRVDWSYLVEVSRDLSQVMDGQFFGSPTSPSAQDVSKIMKAEGAASASTVPGIYLEASDSTTWTIKFIGDTVDQKRFRHALGTLLLSS